ncbi:MAG: MFS transporter [Pseudomonadota bacterium]
MAAVATVGSNSLLLGPIAPGIASDLETAPGVVLRAAAGYGLGTAAGAAFLSPLVDRIGPTRALTWALMALTLFLVLSGSASGVTGLILAQTGAGLAAGIALPAAYALAAQIAPPGRESEVLGRVLIGWTLSLVAGVSLSALLTDFLGWRSVFLLLTGMTLLTLLLLSQLPRPTQHAAHHRLVWPLQAAALPGIPGYLLLTAAFMSAFYAAYAYIGTHLVEVLGLPISASSLLAILYGTGFACAALGDRLIDNLGARRVLVPALAAIAVTYAAMALAAPSALLLMPLFFVWGMVNHFSMNVILARLSALHPAKRGAVLGAYSTTTYLAASGATLGAGWIYPIYGFPGVATGSALAILAALGLARHMVRAPD